jgi:hypothetical protein
MTYVSSEIKPDDLQNLADQVNKLNEMVSINAVKIKDEKKNGVRVMSQGREGYVRLVSKVATQHIDSLSRADDPIELAQRLTYDENLQAARQAVKDLFEYVDGTSWGNSADIMEMADRYVNSLQGQRGNNTALDSAMNEIDEWNKRFGRHLDNEDPESENTTPKND